MGMDIFEPVSFAKVRFHDGFWKVRQDINRRATLPTVWEQFYNTGRITAMDLNWREGEDHEPHIFYDSDVAKWMEGAAYTLALTRDDEIEKRLEWLIDKIERGMTAEGYFNSYYLTKEPHKRWAIRNNHELYCAGHLLEAAIAYYQATGKRRFLDLMIRFCEYIYRVFYMEKSAAFRTPGHQEIELALVRLWQVTKEKKWLELADYFVAQRGRQPDERDYSHFSEFVGYGQDQAPVEEQREPLGHVVRFAYLYTAVADLARETGNEKYLAVCRKLWRHIVDRKMYVTGGVGNMAFGEAFGPDYFLPGFEAYTETCASIGMAYWARRMLQIDPMGEYADICELQMYNGALAGVSYDGTGFFYENPLQSRLSDLRFLNDCGANNRPAQRVKVFSCSCCPPNILRFIASIGDYLYTVGKDCLYIHHYIAGEAEVSLEGKALTITQKTNYPWDGDVEITINAPTGFDGTIALRIPGWCPNASVNRQYTEKNGYWYLSGRWENGDTIRLTLPMAVQELEANPQVAQCAGKMALRYGPFVYCLERADNGEGVFDIAIPDDTIYNVTWQPQLFGGINVICFEALRRKPFEGLYQVWEAGYQTTRVTAIPYFLWGNREAGDMEVWVNRK